MTMIKGITVKLYEKVRTGVDGFNHPLYEETPVEVDNVLVAPASSEGIVTEQDLQGKREIYLLAIPKGDTHEWKNRKVEFFGRVFRTVNVPEEGIEDLIPLDWNKKVKVERYE
mgnify:CR=1 FL=1